MPVELYAQLTVLILSLPLFGRLNWAYRLLIFQVFISLITDYIAYQFSKQGTSNEVIYNIYDIIETLLLSGLVYLSFQSEKIKKGIRISILIYALFTIISLSTHNLFKLDYKLIIVSFIFISSLNLIYIIHPEVNKSFSKNPLMIIAMSHVIYCLGITPYFIGREMIIEQNTDMANELFDYIIKSLMYVRYGLIAIAFIVVWKNKLSPIAHE
jgi:hypothetical protein